MIEFLQMLESMWFLVLFAVGGWVHYLLHKVDSKLEDIKRETADNRERSIAAQDVVKANTEAINKIALILTRIEERVK